MRLRAVAESELKVKKKKIQICLQNQAKYFQRYKHQVL